MNEQAPVPRPTGNATSEAGGEGSSSGMHAKTARKPWYAAVAEMPDRRRHVVPPFPGGLIQSELFSIERLEQYAVDLAGTQTTNFKPTIDRRLERRLHDNQLAVRAAYHECLRAVREERAITPAADWLVNNFHLVEEQVRDIRIDLPPAFHRQLPKLTDGPFQGYARIFSMAWNFIAHTDSEFDATMLTRFLRAYQTKAPLTIGEIWAFPITLRIVLVENLRRAADGIVEYQAMRRQANAAADRLLGSGNREPESAEIVLGGLPSPLDPIFAVQLVHRLHEQQQDMGPALLWLDRHLSAHGTDRGAIVYAEQRHQIAVNVAIRNVITSMRLLSALNWRLVFENVSHVDAMLRAESNFAALDFSTRDRYRRAIEELSRGSQASEIEVTRLTLLAACSAASEADAIASTEAARKRDPGYYLVGSGRLRFESKLGVRPGLQGLLTRANAKVGIAGYILFGLLITCFAVVLVLRSVIPATHGIVALGFALLAVLPAGDAAMALLNCGAMARFDAIRLAGLELADGIPSDLRTIVVMPTLLTSHAGITAQVEHLEVHYLANRDDEISFALLTDWTDAPTETTPDDAALLAAAHAGIVALNLRYGRMEGSERFILLHRARRWNAGQGSWMGWERKRGKLHEFNQLARGSSGTSFVPGPGGPASVPSSMRYVVVVDSDTRLPRGAVRRLVGKMAHPLNRPTFDANLQRVVDGYAILQPRVTPALPTGSGGSLFQAIFSGTSGMDPYACAVSDLYQDLFGEGSYCGKGIYDIDAFEAALAGRVLDNTLLSHDLLEGIFARAGLVSDIELIDEFPTRTSVALARQHRWVRGDWQLLPWIFGFGPVPQGSPRAGALPLVGRWKMIDNLRRSFSAPAAFLALAAGWMLPPAEAAMWTICVAGAIALPAAIPVLTAVLPRRPGLAVRVHLRAVGGDVLLAVSQTLLLIAFLPQYAWVMSDAIVRTLFRLGVSRRNLLEWATAAQEHARPTLDIAGSYQQMAGGIGLTLAALLACASGPVNRFYPALPFLALWFVAPAIARWISLPVATALPRVSADDAKSLRLVARRTWRFFETFVTAQENMLPPDNFQEDPVPVVAARTSPTNLGLYLLSVITARDFGWLGLHETVEKLEATLRTMARMERFRGHFYNWYDTRSLAPLPPPYISSVDSGNLAGHLIALVGACNDLAREPVISAQWHHGITDPLDLLAETGETTNAGSEVARHTRAISHMRDELKLAPTSAYGINAVLVRAQQATNSLTATFDDPTGAADLDQQDLAYWAGSVGAVVDAHLYDVHTLLSWAQNAAGTSAAGSMADEMMPCLRDLPELCSRAIDGLLDGSSSKNANDGAAIAEYAALTDAFHVSAAAALLLLERIDAVRTLAQSLFDEMEFGFLYDMDLELLSIGYRLSDASLDSNHYDLLASEARLASIVAIAKGDVPTKHWFRLGRGVAPVGWDVALISWSGSMFEYLMPSLVMRAPFGSLLEQTIRSAVRRQMSYGTSVGRPWGSSESAYNARDVELTYQYSSFGIPDLGLKRGLGENTVIAPYATALASMVDPGAAVINFAQLAAVGGRGRYGWYEALDYTKSRVPEGAEVAIVRAYMAHHQGMSLVAIGDTLHRGAMRRRFHASPIIQAADLLLQERAPRDVVSFERTSDEADAVSSAGSMMASTQRRFLTPHTPTPEIHLLSNGSYTVMVTAAGSGYSRWRNIAVTRWREDTTCDDWGAYIFLRDRETGRVWSASYQPAGNEPDHYEVAFSEGRAEFRRDDGTVTTGLEISVSAEDDAEVRRVSVTNHGSRPLEIEITSYAEIVLAPPAADDAHPAFQKLFVETEFVPGPDALIATRRISAPDQAPAWAAHLAVVEGGVQGNVQYETDRARFIGRGGTIHAPIAMINSGTLSRTVGTVLDPMFSLRYRLRVAPSTAVRVAFWTLIASSRAQVLDLADKHRSAIAFDRATTLAWTQAQVQLRHFGIGAAAAHLFQRLAGHIVYANPNLRPAPAVLKRGAGPQSALWSQGISGDLPIVLVCIAEGEDLALIRQLVLAYEYWRLKCLAVDLVILNESPGSYAEALQDSLRAIADAVRTQQLPGATRGAIFVLRTGSVPPEARNLLYSAARAVLFARRGNLAEQFVAVSEQAVVRAPRAALPVVTPTAARVATSPGLAFYNGFGGFTDSGRDYVTHLEPGTTSPAPWINVIANEAFGFQVSLDGSGYTWSLNSQQNQLTAWSNDPVGDPPGEVIYLRDDDSGEIWSPTKLPMCNQAARYTVRHGQGFTRFEHTSHGLRLSLRLYVPVNDPVKIARLRITNLSGRARRLSVTSYVEWVLGSRRVDSAPHIITEMDAASGAMLARNPWSIDFSDRVAFVDLGGGATAWTGDRGEFIGRNGSVDHPAGLGATAKLSGRTGGGMDPCGALQVKLLLPAADTTEIVLLLGQAANQAAASALVVKYRAADLDAVLAAVTAFWDDTLGGVQVTTPDPGMDILLNRWLLYQTLACRVWARSAFYQSGGAYGFRDQLQDVMALCVARPAEARAHLLRAASRQFPEGDVQHWWLPQSGRGVRTRISDDRVWLADAVAHYVDVTGDLAVLAEPVAFLDGPVLRDDHRENFFQPSIATAKATLFDHCALALDQSLACGEHGLPFIGTGDWNDGMNRVGELGRGESVWLGWFLCHALTRFARLAEGCNEAARATAWRNHVTVLSTHLEAQAWDGEWYRRAFFDDGTPLGTANALECRIDSIAQSWAVLSGVADPLHAATAMAQVDKYLVRRDSGIVLLFTPPLNSTDLDPGYIKAYPPGIRENGGQYTHGAVWSVMAYAMLGDGDKATELFSILNPIHHTLTAAAVDRYKVEPYVVSADIYAVQPHTGRGGWTWYTGSAGLMYRAGLESILGFRLQGANLIIEPCIPKSWPGFAIVFRYHGAVYNIRVENPSKAGRNVSHAELDGITLPPGQVCVALTGGYGIHEVRVVLG
jgi:cyclic beta-1,2-glucan synthetase